MSFSILAAAKALAPLLGKLFCCSGMPLEQVSCSFRDFLFIKLLAVSYPLAVACRASETVLFL